MTIPLIVFATLSLFVFYSFNPLDAAGGWFAHAIERPASVVPASVQAASNELFEEAHHNAHLPAIILSLLVAGGGILLAFATYYWKKISADAWAARLSGLHQFLLGKWYFDEFYDGAVVSGTLALTRMLRWFDTWIIDGLVNGCASWTKAVVFGYGEHRKEKRFSGAAFLIVGVVVSALTAFWAGQWFWLQHAYATAVFAGTASFALTLFFFWSGAGGFDRYVVDGLVNGAAYGSGFFGMVIRKLQTGKVQTYIMFVLVGVMVLFFMFR
jgi:NADH-quinone oxidoreductase subunit L